MDKKIQEFIKIRNEVVSTINSFSKEKRLVVLFDQWSLKDVIAHLSNWMVHDIDCIKALRENREPYWEPEVDKFNRKGFEARKDKDWTEVYKEFIDLGNQLIDLYKTLPDNLWDKPIWLNKSETAQKFLEENISHWKTEHLGSLIEKLRQNN